MIELLTSLKEAALTEALPSLREANAAGLADLLKLGRLERLQGAGPDLGEAATKGVDGHQVPEGLKPVGSQGLDESKILSIEDARRPVNADFAGQFRPFEDLSAANFDLVPKCVPEGIDGVRWKENGCPDFTPGAKASVEFKKGELTGAYKTDADLANARSDFASGNGWVWHHHENGTTMQLVPKELHAAYPHTGGAAVIRALKAGKEVRNHR